MPCSYCDSPVPPDCNTLLLVVSEATCPSREVEAKIDKVIPASGRTILASDLLGGYAPSTVPCSTAFRWTWDFGDGTVIEDSTSVTRTHAYDEDGTYTITVIIFVKCITVGPAMDVVTVTELSRAESVVQVHCPSSVTVAVDSVECSSKQVAFNVGQLLVDGVADPGLSQIVSALWTFGDGTPSSTDIEPVHTYAVNGTYTVAASFVLGNGATPYDVTTVVVDCPSCCAVELPVRGMATWLSGNFTDNVGKFWVDEASGELVFQQTQCPVTYDMSCVGFPAAGQGVDNVVTASAVEFDDNWDYSDHESIYFPPSEEDYEANAYERGFFGKWRPRTQYVYREALNPGGEHRDFDMGTFDMLMFDWRNGINDPDRWVLASTTTRYSPNGEPVEDRNILDVYSTAKYGYNGTLPVLVAQNAEDHTVAYEGFEMVYEPVSHGDKFFEDGLQFVAGKATYTDNPDNAHTGLGSVRLMRDMPLPVGLVDVSQQSIAEGLLVRFWVRTVKDALSPSDSIRVHFVFTPPGTAEPDFGDGVRQVAALVSSAGEWSLYESVFSDFGAYPPGFELAVAVSVNFASYTYVDDVRIQPMQSEMVCYVYDRAQRLAAVLDDQHYAMIYQYNTEGILVRKLKETVEGVKMISETQYNSAGAPRADVVVP